MSWHVNIILTGRDRQDGQDDTSVMTLWAGVHATSEEEACIGMDEILKLYDERRRWVRTITGPTSERDFETGEVTWSGIVRLSYINEPGPAHVLPQDDSQMLYAGLGKKP